MYKLIRVPNFHKERELLQEDKIMLKCNEEKETFTRYRIIYSNRQNDKQLYIKGPKCALRNWREIIKTFEQNEHL
jgi:hypothetical protein